MKNVAKGKVTILVAGSPDRGLGVIIDKMMVSFDDTLLSFDDALMSFDDTLLGFDLSQ